MNCCCQYGAAVSGEWPEFECGYCPIHLNKDGVFHVCKKHTNFPMEPYHVEMIKARQQCLDRILKLKEPL